ncbi:EfeM/EfeO family lipoprotein [Subtercola boreus]|uniref:Imelysin-like domain-containing protein n=1 Tax=Subtercola boreus TaxID=120213 RepID=A0A3E0W8V6_9MICO|nr:EfeM/EfeO family lipoprotein [Subtercola boreus]RFA19987.1 hypothetical protein B7R24_10375 [Subtercola boreus]RFA20116.1 hypothetical protein B7R23_10315 [Subtercola boreus]RFA26443.1 hypothetical protein B7R25_10440 [Subtercola boreus]
MPQHPAPPRARLALIGAGAALLLLLSGCATNSPGEAAAAAAAKPLSQAAFITRQLSVSSTDFGEYLGQQAQKLSAGTTEFTAAYESGDDDLARALYAPTRSFYNRMLGAAGSFPELDASLDGPSAGWHTIEQALYAPAPATAPSGRMSSPEQRSGPARQLDADTAALVAAVESIRPTVAEQADGVATLLSGRATAAAAGTEQPLSHTDLSDLQGYVDGSREAFSGLRPILVTQNAALATTLDHRFEAVENELNALRTGVTFPGYDTLTDTQRTSLRSAVADLTDSFGIVPDTMDQP